MKTSAGSGARAVSNYGRCFVPASRIPGDE